MGYFDKQWAKHRKANTSDQEQISVFETSLTKKGSALKEALRLNIEKDIPIPEHMVKNVQWANRKIAKTLFKGVNVDEKSLMKKQLEFFEGFENGVFLEEEI
nr:MAG: hypothetical protein BECKSD772E_GA0070983_108812 [Candidatus Kentron sp. SD]